jgi:hypothetical protein
MLSKMFRWLKSKLSGKKVKSAFDKDNPFLIL